MLEYTIKTIRPNGFTTTGKYYAVSAQYGKGYLLAIMNNGDTPIVEKIQKF